MTYLGIVIGLTGLILFRTRNADKRFLNIISGLILLIFSSGILFTTVLGYLLALIYSFLVGGLLIVFYFVRFIKKARKQTIDLLKLFAVLLIAVYPLTFIYSHLYFVRIVGFLIIPYSFIVYIYDRFIVKPEPMKNKFVITLAIQTVLIGLFLIYAFVQKAEADVQRAAAEQQRHYAEEQQKMNVQLLHDIDKLKKDIENLRQAEGVSK
jgi:phosphoglycerol transferase MdoB-like AlkP superfamily enzyme